MEELERVVREVKEIKTLENRIEVIKIIKYRLANFNIHYLDREGMEEILNEQKTILEKEEQIERDLCIKRSEKLKNFNEIKEEKIKKRGEKKMEKTRKELLLEEIETYRTMISKAERGVEEANTHLERDMYKNQIKEYDRQIELDIKEIKILKAQERDERMKKDKQLENICLGVDEKKVELIKEVQELVDKEVQELTEWRRYKTSKHTGRLRQPDEVIYNYKYRTIVKMKEILELVKSK